MIWIGRRVSAADRERGNEGVGGVGVAEVPTPTKEVAERLESVCHSSKVSASLPAEAADCFTEWDGLVATTLRLLGEG